MTTYTSRTLEGQFASRSGSLGSTAIGRTGRGRVACDWKVAQLGPPRCDDGSTRSGRGHMHEYIDVEEAFLEGRLGACSPAS
eukprot:6213861-Pleurochrysis_carterae.AAC.1